MTKIITAEFVAEDGEYTDTIQGIIELGGEITSEVNA